MLWIKTISLCAALAKNITGSGRKIIGYWHRAKSITIRYHARNAVKRLIKEIQNNCNQTDRRYVFIDMDIPIAVLNCVEARKNASVDQFKGLRPRYYVVEWVEGVKISTRFATRDKALIYHEAKQGSKVEVNY